MSEELKSCPFCDGKAEILDGAVYPIGCRKADCYGYIYRDGYSGNKDFIVKAWNTRAEPPSLSVEEKSMPVEKVELNEGTLRVFLRDHPRFTSNIKGEECRIIAHDICENFALPKFVSVEDIARVIKRVIKKNINHFWVLDGRQINQYEFAMKDLTRFAQAIHDAIHGGKEKHEP